MTGIATVTSQAPCANFVQMTITLTTPVAAAPRPFTAMLLRQRPVRVRSQWRTIPAWDSVKAVKTPITYRWISESTFAS